ncbi:MULTISPECIES: hypothetical protein [Moorena]|nr:MULTISPECIES: hypothetical protein [Moorena]
MKVSKHKPHSGSDAEVRPVANLIRLRKAHHYGLGEAARSWGFPP